MKRLRTACAGALVAATGLVLSATPVGAQQIVDAGKQGDGSGALAFVIFSALVMLTAAALFFMDRIRRRVTVDEPEQ